MPDGVTFANFIRRRYSYIFSEPCTLIVESALHAKERYTHTERERERERGSFYIIYRRAFVQRTIFLAGFTVAFIVFSKYTGLVCIFNQRSGRVHPHCCCLFWPAFRSCLTCHAIRSRGTNSTRGDFPGETRYSQFRPARNQRTEGCRREGVFFLLNHRSISGLSLRGFPARIVQSLVLNPISYVPLCVSRRARSTRERDKVTSELARN